MLVNEVRINCVRRLEQAVITNSFEKGFFHLIFVLKGNGVLSTDGTSRCVQENDCLLFDDFSKILVMPDQGASVCLVQIVIKILHAELANELIKCQEKLAVNSRISRSIILKIWDETLLKPPYYEDSVNLSVMNLLLSGIAGKQQNNANLPPASDNVYLLHRLDLNLSIMVEYIEKHLSEEITNSSLTALVNMTPKQLDRLFKQYYGCTSLQFVNNMRLSKAKQLLIYSSYNITEIAELVGFKSIHYFSRFFKEKENISPLGYKEAMGGRSFAV